MVMLSIDNETYAALLRRAAAGGQSVEEWLKSESRREEVLRPPEPPIGDQMALLFSEVGLKDDESIPELKGQTVRLPEFDE
jgi:hypothetical protein